ncbi:MAG: hypothetical protein AAGA27_02955 [Pseudomonadota bacterium]
MTRKNKLSLMFICSITAFLLLTIAKADNLPQCVQKSDGSWVNCCYDHSGGLTPQKVDCNGFTSVAQFCGSAPPSPGFSAPGEDFTTCYVACNQSFKPIVVQITVQGKAFRPKLIRHNQALCYVNPDDIPIVPATIKVWNSLLNAPTTIDFSQTQTGTLTTNVNGEQKTEVWNPSN